MLENDIHIRISEDTRKGLEVLALKQERTISWVARKILERKVKCESRKQSAE